MSESSPCSFPPGRKLLLDSCVCGGAVERLRAAGHDVVRSADWPVPEEEEALRVKGKLASDLHATVEVWVVAKE